MADKLVPFIDDNGVIKKYLDQADGSWAEKVACEIIGTNGAEASPTVYGYLRTTNEPGAIFTEPFDTLDTTYRWTTKLSTGTASITNGTLNISSSTTASAYGGLFTQPTFVPNGVNFLASGTTMMIPNVTQANTVRYWGWGTVPATPTSAAPITHGVGFELSATGTLAAVVYQGGTKVTNTAISTVLTNNVPFYCAMARRADRVDFFINSTTVPVATIQLPSLTVATLPFTFLAVNAASAPAAAAQMNVYAFGIADTGINGVQQADPIYPFYRTRVTAGGAAVSKPYSIPENDWSYAAASGGVINTTDVALAAAAGTGLRRYCTGISLSNNSATATEVVLKDGASTVIWRGMLPANAPNVQVTFPTPLKTTANTALNFACITTAAAVYVNAQGYTAA